MASAQRFKLRAKLDQLDSSRVEHCRIIVWEVSRATGVRSEDLFAGSRRTMKIASARQLAMYLCHTLSGLTMTEVGVLFLRDRTTVSHACVVIEDSREDPRADRRILAIEDEIEAARSVDERAPALRPESAHGLC